MEAQQASFNQGVVAERTRITNALAAIFNNEDEPLARRRLADLYNIANGTFFSVDNLTTIIENAENQALFGQPQHAISEPVDSDAELMKALAIEDEIPAPAPSQVWANEEMTRAVAPFPPSTYAS